MRLLFILSTFAAAALCRPNQDGQFVSVAQSTLGDYKIEIKTNDVSRNEQRDENGNVVGSYAYTDANGVTQTIHYTAGPNGYQATGDNIPVAPVYYNSPVQDTPEVAQAKAEHLAKLQILY